MSDWFYERNGGRHGPVSLDEMRKMFHEGKIGEGSLAWTSNFGRDWKPLRDTEIIGDAGPPPLPAGHVTDVYAWLVALVPVLGAVVERVLADVSPSSETSPGMLFLAYSAAYILLSFLDQHQIKRSGRAKDVALLGWIWLVPIYLVQRARSLGKRQYLIFVWLAAIAASILISAPEILQQGTYWGIGLPPCDSATSKKQVIDIFNDIPLVKQQSIHALSVHDIKESAATDKTRSCVATVDMSNTNSVPVKFSITTKEDQIYYQVEINQETQ